MRQVLVLKNPMRDLQYQMMEEVIAFLTENDVHVFVIEEEMHSFSSPVSHYHGKEKMDFAIFLGGDGTILQFANRFYQEEFLYYGINLGRVGVLAEADKENWKEKITSILQGNYFVEKRNTLDICVKNEEGQKQVHGLNEVAILRGNRLSMMRVNFEVETQGKASCYADGILVSTSTGSSAYSLSVGGSLILPTSPVFSISPINPQIKTFVPIIVPDDKSISLSIESEKEREAYQKEPSPLVVVDGRDHFPILPGDEVVVKKGEKNLNVIKTNRNASLYLPIDKVMKAGKEE